jgi:hypothetical protein
MVEGPAIWAETLNSTGTKKKIKEGSWVFSMIFGGQSGRKGTEEFLII